MAVIMRGFRRDVYKPEQAFDSRALDAPRRSGHNNDAGRRAIEKGLGSMRLDRIFLCMADEPRSDTSKEALAIMSALYAGMNPEQKLRRVRELNRAVNRFSLAGLRNRHPDETDAALNRRLARIRLGPELADEVFADSPDRAAP